MFDHVCCVYKLLFLPSISDSLHTLIHNAQQVTSPHVDEQMHATGCCMLLEGRALQVSVTAGAAHAQRSWQACCLDSIPAVPSVAALQVLQEAGSHLANLAARTASNVLQLRHVLLRLQPLAKVVSNATAPISRGLVPCWMKAFPSCSWYGHLEGELVHQLACCDIEVRAIGAAASAATAATTTAATTIFPPEVVRRRDRLRPLEPRQTRLLLVFWHPLVLQPQGGINQHRGGCARSASRRKGIPHWSCSTHQAGNIMRRPTSYTWSLNCEEEIDLAAPKRSCALLSAAGAEAGTAAAALRTCNKPCLMPQIFV